MRKLNMKKLNRFLNHVYAILNGYFWLPCPICNEYFGGHEYKCSLMTSWHEGVGVCPSCCEEANIRNQKWMKNNPYPPAIIQK